MGRTIRGWSPILSSIEIIHPLPLPRTTMFTTRILILLAVAFLSFRAVIAAPVSSLAPSAGSTPSSISLPAAASTSNVAPKLSPAFWGRIEEPNRADYTR
ncbi:unnamed protein product [Mycena citricolor]|uniref:Uncharacterized protein n=1 Tax=Mycena citricolor TaxID=2018698 RepID=A0AAD2HXI9_9AGAR|nr:unnamed protein product [Mycena citricolor]